MIKLTELYVYPVKSLAGIALEKAELDSFGIKFDRRWMIVDENGIFLTQRSHPQMALIKASIINNQLLLEYKDKKISVPENIQVHSDIYVTVWKDSFYAKHVCSEVDLFLSEALNLSCRLVYMNPEVKRQIDREYAPEQHYVSFSDAFPFLLANQASLDELNLHLSQKAEMRRFRPNIVINGCDSFSEDEFESFSINQVRFKSVKKCSRCPVPTINPKTGVKDNPQILSILSKFRKENNKVYFGQNLIYESPENVKKLTLNIGDELILEKVNLF
jgi:uncharacterized protein YcbX